MIVLSPPPAADELPARLASPFAAEPPGPLARRAAAALVARLRGGAVDAGALDAPGGGKMFGVLVVRAPDGQVGYLAAFSGMLAGRWEHDGFAPPLFDPAAPDALWLAGAAELAVRAARLGELTDGDEARALRAQLAVVDARHAATSRDLRADHRGRKAARADARRGVLDDAARHALDQASRGDTAEARRQDAAHRAERAPLLARLAALDAEAATEAAARAARSRQLLHRIHDTYRIANARGEVRALRALFAPDEPPGGAGDCAGPKLLGEAYRRGLQPLALAELWWGAPPAGGGRIAGAFYPSCRGKCGVVLPFMLDGLDVAAAPHFGADAPAADQPRAVHEDPWLVVVDKPAGLLSVPGRHAALRDSVLVRLRQRYPDATGPLVVHRLDLDTSGLLLAARDAETHAALQQGFARREIEKRYVAWLEGDVVGDAGVIELPLRVDLDDRPRQLVDPIHGKHAVTAWQVLARRAGRTRVALYPRTGRTHQLRVHAAHPAGLGVPIVGDRLYGCADARLLLHAEALTFTHPRTGVRVEVVSSAPF